MNDHDQHDNNEYRYQGSEDESCQERKMNTYLYRIREVDDDLDPLDFGVLRAPDVDAAYVMVTARIIELFGRDGETYPVRVYPEQEVACGLFQTAGQYIDRDIQLPDDKLIAELARLEVERDRLNAEIDRLKG
jgi:hypothetical protein